MATYRDWHESGSYGAELRDILIYFIGLAAFVFLFFGIYVVMRLK